MSEKKYKLIKTKVIKKTCHAGKFWELTDKIYPVTLANTEILGALARVPGYFFSFQSKKFRDDIFFSFMRFSLYVKPPFRAFGSLILIK